MLFPPYRFSNLANIRSGETAFAEVKERHGRDGKEIEQRIGDHSAIEVMNGWAAVT